MDNKKSKAKNICRSTMSTLKFHILLCGFLVGTSSSVLAEWQRLDSKPAGGSELFMDSLSVKQAGPMAIYQQVQVLSQGPNLLWPTVASTTTLYEYNCMTSLVRVLQVVGFDKPWAAGNKLELLPSPPSPAAAQWHISAEASLAQPMVDKLCPRGDDSSSKNAN
jgi:hypothetical protein